MPSQTPGTRSALASILKATALAASISRRLAISDAVGYPADVRADLAEGQRLLSYANFELEQARRRSAARYR